MSRFRNCMYHVTMVGPSSQVSKLLLVLLILLLSWFVLMDFFLYLRVKNYPIDRGSIYDNVSTSYKDVSWVSCHISPLCDITVKGLLLDHLNLYVYSPLATILDDIFRIHDVAWITPNGISVSHVFVAMLAGRCVASDSLLYRRLGVLLFQIRMMMDDLDGHVARVRKHVKGEHSEIGSSGYYVDGLCDGLGGFALLVGAFIFLKNNPPRRGYMQLPTVVTNDKDKDTSIIYKAKVTTRKVACKMCLLTLQLVLSSLVWNRYIAIYQELLERNDVDLQTYNRQSLVFQSSFFFIISWLWRIVSVHNMLHCLLLSIFCDKLWEYLRCIQYIGFGILLTVACVTEVYVVDVKNFIYRNPSAY